MCIIYFENDEIGRASILSQAQPATTPFRFSHLEKKTKYKKIRSDAHLHIPHGILFFLYIWTKLSNTDFFEFKKCRIRPLSTKRNFDCLFKLSEITY